MKFILNLKTISGFGFSLFVDKGHDLNKISETSMQYSEDRGESTTCEFVFLPETSQYMYVCIYLFINVFYVNLDMEDDYKHS